MFELHHGDNREVLKTMADNSIDSIVTDPPYELGFMGKSWDASGIAYDVELWREVLRVLKPGGHLLAFSGSRTYHRMVVAIEDAGFEIRDQIMWIYGSGFPKSHNVANAIDKKMGASNRGHAISSGSQIHPTTGEKRPNGELLPKYESRTLESEGWAGWGTALKPAHEPIVVARKPLIGTVADNVLTYGTGGLNIDGTRVGWASESDRLSNVNAGGFMDSGYVQKSNVMNRQDGGIYDVGRETIDRPVSNTGRWPANVIHDGSDEVVELFPSSKGNGAIGGGQGGIWTTGNKQQVSPGYTDNGSAARFFYCAKASKRDRNEGEVVNNHPTVKPTDLMRYLCRLVTPPNGIVLDPFMGSGSTGKAAVLEGFNFVGIEMTDEYLPIAKARIEFAIDEMAGKLL